MTKNDGRMPFTAHLAELRKRLIISVAALAAGFLACYGFAEPLYRFLSSPLMAVLPEGHDYLVFTGVVEPFFIYMKVGFLAGLVASSPVILYQVWAFVAPGLYRDEKKWFVSIVAASLVLFISGVVFAYLVVFPFGFGYLMGYSSAELRPVLSMGIYFSMVTRLLVAFGLVFQLPLVMLVVARLGLATAGQLASWWRYAVVLIMIAAAVITPTPDALNQMLMAGPLIVLYGVGIVAAAIFGKKSKVEKGGDGEKAG